MPQDRETKLAKARAFSKEWYAKKVGRPVGRKGQRLPETAAREEARRAAKLSAHQQRIAAQKAKRKSICRACGNDRIKHPDRHVGNGRMKCSRCVARRRKASTARRLLTPAGRAAQKAAKAVYRNRLRAAGGKLTAAQWTDILTRYGAACASCGSTKDLQLDHIVPVAQGGTNSANNVQPLCGICNNFKSARVIDYRPCRGRPGPGLPPIFPANE